MRLRFIKKKWKLLFRNKGGPGSGNFGHTGRPGQVGGSGGSGAVRSTASPKDYITSLPSEQHNAIVDYTRQGYKLINKHLRDGIEVDDATKKVISDIDAVMDSAPPIKTATLYRALAMSPEELGLEVGSMYQDSAFVSTTKSARLMFTDRLLSRLPTRVTIKLPKATRGDVRGVAAHFISNKKSEQEILLDRNTIFKVVSIGKQGNFNAVTLEVISNE